MLYRTLIAVTLAALPLLAGCGKKDVRFEFDNELREPVPVVLEVNGRPIQAGTVQADGKLHYVLTLQKADLPVNLTYQIGQYRGAFVIDKATKERVRIKLDVDHHDGVPEVKLHEDFRDAD